MRPSDAEIVMHHDDDPEVTGLVLLPGWESWASPKTIMEYDPAWPDQYQQLAVAIRKLVGDQALDVLHVGSTSVPTMPAKPVIDIDLVVVDPAKEDAYVEGLQGAGFHFHAREPGWHQHRLLKYRSPFAHVHVFGPDCAEVIRHVMFRNWLIAHPDERALYARAKLQAAAQHPTAGDYTKIKEPVVREIYERMFRAHGLI